MARTPLKWCRGAMPASWCPAPVWEKDPCQGVPEMRPCWDTSGTQLGTSRSPAVPKCHWQAGTPRCHRPCRASVSAGTRTSSKPRPPWVAQPCPGLPSWACTGAVCHLLSPGTFLHPLTRAAGSCPVNPICEPPAQQIRMTELHDRAPQPSATAPCPTLTAFMGMVTPAGTS